MKKPPVGPPQVVQLFPAKASRAATGKIPESVDQLVHSSLKLRKLEEMIGRPALDQLIGMEGEPKGLFILHRFVQYNDDFKNAADFFLYSFACGRYLSKQEPGGKFVEAFPVKIDSRETIRERSKYFNATRRIGRYFHELKLGAEEAKSFVEEVSPFVFPMFMGRDYNESLMLRDSFIKDMIDKFGFGRFLAVLRIAVKNKPDNLQKEIYERIKEQ